MGGIWFVVALRRRLALAHPKAHCTLQCLYISLEKIRHNATGCWIASTVCFRARQCSPALRPPLLARGTLLSPRGPPRTTFCYQAGLLLSKYYCTTVQSYNSSKGFLKAKLRPAQVLRPSLGQKRTPKAKQHTSMRANGRAT